MDNTELLEEIRLNREEIKNLQKEFFIFKGKAFGFLTVLVALAEIVKNKLF